MLSPALIEISLIDSARAHAFFYADKSIHYPPVLPIPGDDSEPEFGECAISWGNALPYTVFSAICQLSTLIQEFAKVFLSKTDNPNPDHIRLDFVEPIYKKLLGWVEALPSDLARNGDQSMHGLVLQ